MDKKLWNSGKTVRHRGLMDKNRMNSRKNVRHRYHDGHFYKPIKELSTSKLIFFCYDPEK